MTTSQDKVDKKVQVTDPAKVDPKTAPKADPKPDDKPSSKPTPPAKGHATPPAGGAGAEAPPKRKRGRPPKDKPPAQPTDKVRVQRKTVDRVKDTGKAIRNLHRDLEILYSRHNEENETTFEAPPIALDEETGEEISFWYRDPKDKPQMPKEVIAVYLKLGVNGLGKIMDVETRPTPEVYDSTAEAYAELSRYLPMIPPVIVAAFGAIACTAIMVWPMITELRMKNAGLSPPVKVDGKHEVIEK